MLFMNFKRESQRLHNRIHSIQAQLAQLEPMRPGCLTLQYRNPKEKSGANYQLSYTYQMKSKTEYISAALVPQIRQEIAEYKHFRKLTAEWIALSIELSRLKIKDSKASQ